MDAGQWLVEKRSEMDRGESEWLERLAEFDRDGLWDLDGHFSCVAWLVWRLNMGRSTAFDKLRVAHELARRPVVAEAFRDGRISYSAVRAITRMERPDPDVDKALVELAASGKASIADVERVVRSYHLYADQDRPPTDERDRARDVRIIRGDEGTGQVVITGSDLEIEEMAAALQAFIDIRYRPVDESSGGDGWVTTDDPTPAAIRADAFMDMVRTALEHADGERAAGDDRYLVHVVTRDGGISMNTLDGTPLCPQDSAMIKCDCSLVSHGAGGGWEPLTLGRKTREWSTAQRRAISVRDGGHCRYPGCTFKHYDIHHMQPWEAGGPTDVRNGVCCCPRHHHKLHSGFSVKGDPNGELRFQRPDGLYIGSTYPAGARSLSYELMDA